MIRCSPISVPDASNRFADVIEIGATVHARMNVRLGDDQRPRLLEERHDLRRKLEKLVAALEHPQFARAHDAERALEIRFQRLPVDAIVAQAEEGEVVGKEPLQELNGFRDFTDRQRRRIVLQVGNNGVNARAHRLPVLHGHAHFTEHDLERAHEFFARSIIDDRSEVDMDETLTLALRIGCAERDQFAVVAAHAEHRVRDQAHIETSFGKFAHHRVDQEGHVVVDDLDHRNRLASARGRERHGLAADLRRARRALRQKIIGTLGQRDDVVGAVAHDILRHASSVKLRNERARNIATTAGQRRAREFDHVAGGLFFVAGGKFDGHGTSCCFGESVEAHLKFSPSARERREQHTIW